MAQTFEFQAEARQLLDLMVHSIYSNKDIFLRELISNASDALDKRRFESLTQPALMDSGTELAIDLEVDPQARILRVVDNGIGMSRDEVVRLIGTIARSGTREYLEKLKSEKKAGTLGSELIGQFGVGFYSSFMVAGKVELLTRKAGEAAATRWESSGDGAFTVDEAERPEPGTTVTLHLKAVDEEDALKDYCSEAVLRQIVKRYSDFVAHPIRLRGSGGSSETLNSRKAIWMRAESEVSEEEHNEFYKHIAHDWSEPLLRIRARIEGTLEYRMLLFVPGRAPFDLFHRERGRGLQLYIKRVFILDECRELVPDWLRFLRGVVDSEDLSLNVSREILQQDRQIRRMRKGIVGKVLSAFQDLAKEGGEKWTRLWANFGRVLKEGLVSDPEYAKEILGLIRCESTRGSELVTLAEYTERMKPSQKGIYFLCGETREALASSPQLEALIDRGFEVLLLTDPIDEIWTDRGLKHEGHAFIDVAKGEDLGLEGDAEKLKASERSLASVLEYLKNKLSEHVKEVRLSRRLKSSPACLVGDPGDLSPQLEELLRAANQEVPRVRRVLEVNPDHPLLARLSELFEKDRSSPRLREQAELLYGQAVIAEGGKPPNPAAFAKLIAELMLRAAD